MSDIMQEALDAIALMLNTSYSTGIGWLDRDHNTLTIDWVDDTTTTFTLTVTHDRPARYVATRNA